MESNAIERVGLGYDIHRLVPGRKLILGGVPIEYELGLAGHSDADVVLHAIIDALLGAAGLPDIGEQFPDTDPAYKGIDSRKLLSKSANLISDKGLRVINLDVVVIAEKPKLSRYKLAMRQSIAKCMELSSEAINVKAKTNEGLDACGRGEAIACHVVAGLAPMKK